MKVPEAWLLTLARLYLMRKISMPTSVYNTNQTLGKLYPESCGGCRGLLIFIALIIKALIDGVALDVDLKSSGKIQLKESVHQKERVTFRE